MDALFNNKNEIKKFQSDVSTLQSVPHKLRLRAGVSAPLSTAGVTHAMSMTLYSLSSIALSYSLSKVLP
jgi:hypothetical protein